DANGKFVFVTSQMGRIADVDSSYGWVYRVSKAALNMAVVAAQPDYPKATFVAINPGWVQTEMGGAGAPLMVQDRVACMRRGAGLDYLTLALVLEEIAAGDGGTSTAISVTNCPVNAILMRYGNAAQKQKWLTRLAQGELLGVFCLTEPHVGSDASALRATATR